LPSRNRQGKDSRQGSRGLIPQLHSFNPTHFVSRNTFVVDKICVIGVKIEIPRY